MFSSIVTPCFYIHYYILFIFHLHFIYNYMYVHLVFSFKVTLCLRFYLQLYVFTFYLLSACSTTDCILMLIFYTFFPIFFNSLSFINSLPFIFFYLCSFSYFIFSLLLALEACQIIDAARERYVDVIQEMSLMLRSEK